VKPAHQGSKTKDEHWQHISTYNFFLKKHIKNSTKPALEWQT
jgi:hypothetical protein